MEEATVLGTRVAEYREIRGMSLRQLAAAAGISSSFLSQLENHRTSASISSLRKLASALGVTVADLLSSSTGHVRGVLRAVDRPHYPSEAGSDKYVISQAPLSNVEVYISRFDVGGSTGDEQYSHGKSQEIFIVLSGEVEIHLGSERIQMSEHDSIEYLSSVPHRVVNVALTVAETMWITSPPTPA